MTRGMLWDHRVYFLESKTQSRLLIVSETFQSGVGLFQGYHGSSEGMRAASQTQFRVTPLTATVSRNYRQWHRPMNVCGRSSGGGPEPTIVHQLRKSKAYPYQEGVT